MEERVVVRYYRKGYRVPRGCVVGIVKDVNYTLGYSLYHKNLEKSVGISFSKKRAVQIAQGRAIKNNVINWPSSLLKTVLAVKVQCEKIIGGGNSNGREDGTSSDKS